MKKVSDSCKNKHSVCYTRLVLELSCRTCKYKEECEKVKEHGYHSLYDYYNNKALADIGGKENERCRKERKSRI